MRISTSTSFVVASIALSSSTLAIPVAQTDPIPSSKSPDLAASPHAPHSARVDQDSQIASFGRPGRGRPPAIRSGSGSRRSLPRRRSQELIDTADGGSKVSGPLAPLQGVVTTVENTLEPLVEPLGLALITPTKENVDDPSSPSYKPLRFARQIPQGAIPLAFPQAPGAASQGVNAMENTIPFEISGIPGTAEGLPGVAEGQFPGNPVYGSVPGALGQPPFGLPSGQPGLPGAIAGLSPQMIEDEIQRIEAGLPVGQAQAGASSATSTAGRVPSQLQSDAGGAPGPVGGFLSGVPIGTVVGIPGQLAGLPNQVIGDTPLGSVLGGLPLSQIEGLTGGLGSTAGQGAGQTPAGGLPNPLSAVGGLTGAAGSQLSGIEGSLPIFGGLVPPNLFGALQGAPASSDSKSSQSGKPEPTPKDGGNAFDAMAPPKSESVLSTSSTIVTTESTSTSSATLSGDESDSTALFSTMDHSTSTTFSTASPDPTFVVNVASAPVVGSNSHSIPTSSHSLPVAAPTPSNAPKVPSSPPGPVINVEAPSPDHSPMESSSSLSSQSTFGASSSTAGSSTADTSSSMSTSSTSTSASSTASVAPAERRLLLSRIARFLRRGDPPLPKGFAAPTAPIANDTPPLLQATVNFAAKVEKDVTSIDASASVTSQF